MPRLIEPLIETGRQAITTACDHYALIIHDWSQLMYAEHAGKRDRVALSSRHVPEGYELQTALLVSDRNGSPLAPVVMSLRAADGVHCSRQWRIRPALSPLDELAPAMAFAEQQSFSRPLVHVIDAEADSVAHYREWAAAGWHFLVRADDRLVEYQGQERRCSAIREELREQGAFRQTRLVKYHGRSAQQWVAEVSIRLLRPGQRNRPLSEDRQRIPGAPLSLRLVISEVRSPDGKLLATWYLLANVATDVEAGTLALWYYWRWSIESFFKLLKSARHASRTMATGDCRSHCTPLACGLYGVRYRLAIGAERARSSRSCTTIAGAAERSTNETRHHVYDAGFAGGHVDAVGNDRGARTS